MGPRSSGTTRRNAIAVVGGAIMDLVFEAERMPENDQSLDASSLAYKPGGKGSNTAIAIYRAQHDNPENQVLPARTTNGGRNQSSSSSSRAYHDDYEEIDVYLNTAIGKDAFGRQLKENLKQNGVNVSGIRTSTNDLTGTCAVFVDEFTRSSRDIGFPGANTNWKPKNPDSIECLANGNTPILLVSHLENKRETIEHVLELAYKNQVDTLLNPSPVTYLVSSTYKHVTHLVINELEAAELFPDKLDDADDESFLKAAKYFMEQGTQHVVITLGDKGAFYASGDISGRISAVKGVRVKDTTGAGDTFVGNYALEYVRQKQRGLPWDIKKAVERSCKAAARTIEQLGAQDSIPWADEIHDDDPPQANGFS